jgi:hypothetical protein
MSLLLYFQNKQSTLKMHTKLHSEYLWRGTPWETGHRGEGRVKIYDKEMGCEIMDGMQLAQDRVLWHHL